MIAVCDFPADVPAGVPRCSVLIPMELSGTLPVLARCPEPAGGHWRGVCMCGHVRDGNLCAGHAAAADEGGCRACLELAGGAHDCALPVARTGDAS
jgi:hypothetical protein